MYQDEYKRWAAADLEDFDLNQELNAIADDDEAIKDRFAVALEFGTAGLRGTLGAGTNRMNISCQCPRCPLRHGTINVTRASWLRPRIIRRSITATRLTAPMAAS